MSFTAMVRGRREPRRARADVVGGIAAARLTLEAAFGLQARAAAVAFEPLTVPRGLDDLVAGVAADIGSIAGSCDDARGYRWLTLAGGSPDDLAVALGVIAGGLHAGGAEEHLLCAVCAFTEPVTYLVYNFARGAFYAFVPRDEFRRDAPAEQRLHEALALDLRLERDPRCRYPIWGLPL